MQKRLRIVASHKHGEMKGSMEKGEKEGRGIRGSGPKRGEKSIATQSSAFESTSIILSYVRLTEAKLPLVVCFYVCVGV